MFIHPFRFLKSCISMIVLFWLFIFLLVLASCQDAHAKDHRSCVTINEYRAVHDEMRKSRVHEIFDTNGHQAALIPHSVQQRNYEPCWKTNGKVHVYYYTDGPVWRAYDKDRPPLP